MLFVDLNDNFSCQEFDRLLCNFQLKAVEQGYSSRNDEGPQTFFSVTQGAIYWDRVRPITYHNITYV